MTGLFKHPNQAITAAAGSLVAVGILLLTLETFHRSIGFDAVISGGGTALTLAQIIRFALEILFSILAPLLVLCLPIPTVWRVSSALLLLGLIWIGTLSLLPLPGLTLSDIRPLGFPIADLAMKVPLLALGIWMAARAFGAKSAWLMAIFAALLTVWDIMISVPHIEGQWMLWLCAVFGITLGARRMLPGAVFPWALALSVYLLLPWLWAAAPQIGPALFQQDLSNRLPALIDAVIAPPGFFGGNLVGPASLCATLGAMAALTSGRSARSGDWIAAMALAISYIVIEFAAAGALRTLLAAGGEILQQLLLLPPVLSLIGAAIWLYFRWDRA